QRPGRDDRERLWIWLAAAHGSRLRADHRLYPVGVPCPIQDSAKPPSSPHKLRRPQMSVFTIGFVIFPNLTQLDFTGPLQVLNRLPDSKVHIVAKSLEPVPSDCGLSLVPTTTFQDCPPLDLICVPGGFGVVKAMTDPETVDFVRRRAEGARY